MHKTWCGTCFLLSPPSASSSPAVVLLFCHPSQVIWIRKAHHGLEFNLMDGGGGEWGWGEPELQGVSMEIISQSALCCKIITHLHKYGPWSTIMGMDEEGIAGWLRWIDGNYKLALTLSPSEQWKWQSKWDWKRWRRRRKSYAKL